jgi:hypothetical protein
VSPEQWREQIGRHIESRREVLRLSRRAAAARAGFSEGQWRQMESGIRTVAKGHFVTVNPRPSTRADASVALGWTEDSIDRLERGEEPIVAEPAPTGLAAAVAELGDHVQRLDSEVAELRRVVDDLRDSGSHLRAAEGAGIALPASPGETRRSPQPAPESGEHATD